MSPSGYTPRTRVGRILDTKQMWRIRTIPPSSVLRVVRTAAGQADPDIVVAGLDVIKSLNWKRLNTHL